MTNANHQVCFHPNCFTTALLITPKKSRAGRLNQRSVVTPPFWNVHVMKKRKGFHMLLSMAPTTWNIKSLQYGHKENTNQPEEKKSLWLLFEPYKTAQRETFFSITHSNRGTEELFRRSTFTNTTALRTESLIIQTWSLLASILSLD